MPTHLAVDDISSGEQSTRDAPIFFVGFNLVSLPFYIIHCQIHCQMYFGRM